MIAFGNRLSDSLLDALSYARELQPLPWLVAAMGKGQAPPPPLLIPCEPKLKGRSPSRANLSP